MGSPYSKLIESIPPARDKTFPSKKALGDIMAHPEIVPEDKNSYNVKFEQCVKLRYRDIERHTLNDIGKLINTIPMTQVVKTHFCETDWEFDSCEETDMCEDTFMFLGVKEKKLYDRYELAFCFLKANTRLSNATLIGGLINEGLLGKDDSNVYFKL